MCSSLFTKFPYVEYSITTFLLKMRLSTYIPHTTQDPSMLIIPLDLCNKTKYRSGTFSHYAPGLEQATLPSTDLYR